MKSYKVLNAKRETVAKFGVLYFENGSGEVEVSEINGATIVRDSTVVINSENPLRIAEQIRRKYDAWHAEARIAVLDA